jgi:hypothetical protein
MKGWPQRHAVFGRQDAKNAKEDRESSFGLVLQHYCFSSSVFLGVLGVLAAKNRVASLASWRPKTAWRPWRLGGKKNEHPRQRHRQPAQPPPAAAGLAPHPGPRLRGRQPRQGGRPRGGARSHQGRVPDRHRLRAGVPVPVLRPGDRRGEDAADGGVHRLPVPGREDRPLLRPGPEPDDLQQADRRLHPRQPEVRLPGRVRVRHQPARNHHRRQLRERPRRPRQDAVRGRRGPRQHLQHLEDQLRGAGREGTPHQAAERVHRGELLRVPVEAGRPRPADGRVAPLPGVGRGPGDQRTAADPGAGTDRHAAGRAGRRDRPVQERDLQLPAVEGAGRRVREGAGRRHPRELRRRQLRRRRPGAAEARRRDQGPRRDEGSVGGVREPEQRPPGEAVRAGRRPGHGTRQRPATAHREGRLLRRPVQGPCRHRPLEPAGRGAGRDGRAVAVGGEPRQPGRDRHPRQHA